MRAPVSLPASNETKPSSLSLARADGAAASGDAVLDGADGIVEPELFVNGDGARAPCISRRRRCFRAGRSG